MKILKRVPLNHEAIKGTAAVKQYDKGARLYMLPEYKYFAHKVRRRGIRAGKVLDIGTGSGRLAIELAKTKGNEYEITGLDVSQDMLARAKENAKAAGMNGKITFIKGNGAALPFPDKSFDLVVSYASLHHWANPEQVFAEARRVVKEGGAVIIRDNRRVYGNPFWEVFIRGLSLFMNKRHRDNWPKAIMSSYTLPEVQEIIHKSGLDYRVGLDFIKFDLCVETPLRKNC
ncbi:MAG: methyltransferase domain-containing protein [Dehalococcoidales bacterium]|jgi:ubiquinone/menaquinone biosynthesis C-methylase UbiE